MKHNIFIFSLFLIYQTSFAQDYTRYYQLIDSAKYFIANEDYVKGDYYYQEGLNSYSGFPNDYDKAILNNYVLHNKLNFYLIKSGFSNGLLYRDLKYSLEQYNVPYSKRKLKKIYRKNKLKKKKSALPVHFAMIRDQRSRSKKNGDISKADSITGVKLKKWMVKKPHLFNRFETNYYSSEMIGILMIHSGWKNLESVQDKIYSLTKKGLIHRDVFGSIIERSALYDGYIFTIDSVNQKIAARQNLESRLCNDTYYSNIFVGYGGLRDSERQATILPPIHHLFSEEEINKLRNHLFFSDVSLLYGNPRYLKVSTEEYCDFMEKLGR
ncbi:hypothetical protein ERX46_13895 [Brumimicrobium glaciale]|uniref:Uncharacterized protein n=1 Tax=Brumimicrobium glaciale TaxID=200475 RepID=A0A4Q4KHX8_9FLAO|nr:hypothetical protein [Brumimicrobium glaciale]RYM32370.1 hypothetical protein ERX46_13895 [Brumimicrobium glaciale]